MTAVLTASQLLARSAGVGLGFLTRGPSSLAELPRYAAAPSRLSVLSWGPASPGDRGSRPRQRRAGGYLRGLRGPSPEEVPRLGAAGLWALSGVRLLLRDAREASTAPPIVELAPTGPDMAAGPRPR